MSTEGGASRLRATEDEALEAAAAASAGGYGGGALMRVRLVVTVHCPIALDGATNSPHSHCCRLSSDAIRLLMSTYPT
jgi:hypothetical protein